MSNATPEKILTIFDDQADLDNTIISKIDMYVKTPEELNKYANWFFHPKGDVSFPSKDSAQSVGSDDFSVFSDGSETLTDAFTSDESVESAEPVIKSSEEIEESIEVEDATTQEPSNIEIINAE